ncbi:IS1/IS1595 family N-terminal zinc-binding domain-containing protein, partial [Sulfurihydrogenibium azorense]
MVKNGKSIHGKQRYLCH